MSLNKVMLIGNVGKEPVVRHLESNVAVASFTLATTERYKDRTGSAREVTEWHNIVCWRGLAETCEKYVHRGTQLYVEGSIRTRSWESQDGQKHSVTEIVADNFKLLGRRNDNSVRNAESEEPVVGDFMKNDVQTTDDLPF